MSQLKVMCVSPINKPEPGKENEPFPEVGDECVVTATEFSSIYGAVYYRLSGYPADNGYLADCFAALPSESEEVGIEHQHEAIIYAR